MISAVDRARTDLSGEGADVTGESRRKRLSAKLVRNNTNGAYTTANVGFRVRNPSTRLRVMISIGFRPDSGDPTLPGTLTGWTATLDAWTKHDSGFYLPANGVIPGPSALSTQLPWAYETTTMVDRLVGNVAVPNAPGTSAVAGFLWISAAWEVDSGAVVGDGELADIFKQCALDVEDTIVVSQFGV